MGGIGDSGRYTNACNRDLENILPHNYLSPPSPVQLPLRPNIMLPPGHADWTDRGQTIIWPHELFSHIYHHYKDVSHERICPSTGALSDFWRATRGNPQIDFDEIRARGNFETKCVPIRRHGDDVPVTGTGKAWCKKMSGFSWSSILGRGSTLQRMFYIYSCFEKLLSNAFGHTTYRQFSRKIRWSLWWLWLGRWPTHDSNGVAYLQAGVISNSSLPSEARKL